MLTDVFYTLKPLIPRWVQIALRGAMVRGKRRWVKDVWPIAPKSARPPDQWKGWPEGKRFALVLTHDVELARGQERCVDLARLESAFGLRSSFNFVPERYDVSPHVRRYLTDHGFEVGVHGLCHDGKLYQSRELFRSRALRINRYLKEWNAVGFRSPSMQHNLDWIHDLDIEYDASTFDTDPFEPQPDGMGTIFPFFVPANVNGNGNPNGQGYVELPYTLPQDSTLFVLMRERNIDIWKRKLDWVVKHKGMVLLNTHPDYINFGKTKLKIDEYPSRYYGELLEYVTGTYKDQFCHLLPRKIACYWMEYWAAMYYNEN